MIDRRARREQAWRMGTLWLGIGAVLEAVALLFGLPAWLVLGVLAVVIWGADRHLRQPGAVPVLVYHSVSDDAAWLPWAQNTSVRVAVFRRHMRVLKRGRWQVVSSRALAQARQTQAVLPARAVVVQFDDGYLDNWVAAVPILREMALPATIFASADFIDQTTAPRPQLGAIGVRWDGYMNLPELQSVDAEPLFEIACHGADHGRVAVSARTVGQLTPGNWRAHAAQFWADSAENKSDWYQKVDPPAAYGTPVPETDSALTGMRWNADTGPEGPALRDQRIRTSLRRARVVLGGVLGREVDFLCWPYDRVTPQAEAQARHVGFALFTGGRGENRADEAADVQSRVHINDHAAGPAPIWVEGWVFRAKLGVAAGNYWWMPLTALAARRRARHLPTPTGPRL